MKKMILPLLLLVGVLLSSSTIKPHNLFAVTSTFDSGLDGWSGDEITWSSTGGNPGGFVKFMDSSGASSDITAPLKFLGDWSSLDGYGSLSYNHKIFKVGTGINAFLPYCVWISGPGGKAVWIGVIPSGVTGWTTQTISINQLAWTITSGSWSALLGNVTALIIRIEQVNGHLPGDEDGIDNIVLTAPCSDQDIDSICDDVDNCPNTPNGSSLGTCSATSDKPGVPCTGPGDCVIGCSNNGECIMDQRDADSDGHGDVCDNCPNDANKTEPGICGCGIPDTDSDSDGIANCIDPCPNDPNNDADADGRCADVDNCPTECNPQQLDADGDGIGDVCDTDPGCGGCSGVECEQQC